MHTVMNFANILRINLLAAALSTAFGYKLKIFRPNSLIVLSASTTVRDMSSQMKDIRASLAADERSSLMLDALRGKNINDDDKQGEGINMQVVEMIDIEGSNVKLPTVYDPVQLEKYFKERPEAIVTRVFQVVSVSFTFFTGLAFDLLTGNTKDLETRKAAEARNTIVSLGPFFIKLGQALSIRPDILSPRSMVELQQLCDKVPSFNNELAMKTIEEELGKSPEELFSEISPAPVAAASLGQVYKAKLRENGDIVAVKVQRPFVLETVSLDLHLGRQLGLFLRNFPQFSNRLDIVALLDEFAGNFYQELDYNLECANGIKIAEDMKKLPMVKIPKCYPDYTARRVHTAEWVEGEKLSQSTEDDVGALVNLGVITYLTQLLDTGFFHADPHPGNMLRTPDGRLVILDFGLMTRITDDQKYGMIEAIAHLIHRDYDQIGNDFVNLDFIPRGTDTTPIIPALARVFEAALAGGGAKSINFQELASDLAEITFKFPFRIPPYFALIIRAISVLEGIALVGNPEFAIVDEAYPYISRRLMTDESPRLRAAFRYMVYGRGKTLDADRLIDMLQALEKFVSVRDGGDGSAFKVDGKRGGVYVGKGGDSLGTRKISSSRELALQYTETEKFQASSELTKPMGLIIDTEEEKEALGLSDDALRESLKFFFSDEGFLFREFVLEELTSGVDAISRDAAREIVMQLGIPGDRVPSVFKLIAPKLNEEDRKVVDSVVKLVRFFLGEDVSNPDISFGMKQSEFSGNSNPNNRDNRNDIVKASAKQHSVTRDLLRSLRPRNVANTLLNASSDREGAKKLRSLLPSLREFAPNMRDFGFQLLRKLTQKTNQRLIAASLDAVFGPDVRA